ncbi:SLC13 family permease [Ferrimonas senticii]|uniref:SLC13 family permease n=1 Tax=Ferrimonas senticii TaxID=394566 RepID=UPI00040FEEA8|nr:SLC13 family permease [Ferrimonas senticii]
MRHWLLFLLIFVAWLGLSPYLSLPWQGLGLTLLALLLWTLRPLPELHSALLIPLLAFSDGMLPIGDLIEIGSSPTLAIFVFGFAFASLSRSQGLDTITLTAISHWANGSERRASYLLFALTALISMWTSNAVTTALMLPLALMLGQHRSVAQQHYLAIAITFSSTLGGMATQAGSSTSFIASNLTGLGFIDWMLLALPLSVALWLLAMVILEYHFKPSFSDGIVLPKQALNRQQWQALALVALTIGGFVVASILWRGSSQWYGLIPVLGVVAMLALKLITLPQLQRAIKYRVLLVFVAAISLGKALQYSGGGQMLVDGLMPCLSDLPLPLQLGLLLLTIALLTELMSNVTCAAILAPLLSLVLLPQGSSEQQIALLVGIGCALAFVLPTATPSNSLMTGVAAVPLRQLAQAGIKVKLATVLGLWGVLLLL